MKNFIVKIIVFSVFGYLGGKICQF